MKNTMLKKTLPLVAATWVDAFRRVCNRIALVAAAICAAAAPLSSFAEAKSATLKATGYSGSAITGFQVLVKLSASNDAYGFSYNEAGGSSHSSGSRARTAQPSIRTRSTSGIRRATRSCGCACRSLQVERLSRCIGATVRATSSSPPPATSGMATSASGT